MDRPYFLLAAFMLIAVACGLISCALSNPNSFRALISITVTPETADAQNYGGQVTFTAIGTFSQPPLTGPVPSTAPYSGTFTLSGGSVATVVSTGTGTLTVQCVSGASGTAQVIAIGNANNGTSATVSGSGQLTCP